MKDDFHDVEYQESKHNEENIIRGKVLYFSTSQVANLLSQTDSRIRYYTNVFENILKIEISNKQRRYTQQDVDKLKFLIELKDQQGMTIKQIQEYAQEMSFEEGIQIKESNPLSLQAIAKALMEEHYNQLQELKNDIRNIVETTVENKLNSMMESNNILMDNAREQIALTVDGIVSENIEKVSNLITNQNEIAITKIDETINAKIDQLEANATARDVDLISKIQKKLDEHKKNYEEESTVKEEKKGFFSKLFK